MITERAMLAAVHISIWTAIKHDRKVSREVAEQHGAYAGAGRYNKQLLREAERLESLRALSGQIRQYFYTITLPWSDEGYRLLPAHFYFELTTKMREFEQAFAQQVEEFLAVYPSYIEQVRPELNGLFREEDYPSTDTLRNKFGVKLEVLPIPSGNDFRVTLSEEEQARVAREIDENVRQSLQKGTEDLWTRLKGVVAHMVERLNEPESRFQLCPIHRSSSCCGREAISKERRQRQMGVRRIDDPQHPRGYRELRSNGEMRKLLDRKIIAQNGICGICKENFTDYSDVVPDHICPRGMGGAWRDDHPDNIQAVHWWCNGEKGSTRG